MLGRDFADMHLTLALVEFYDAILKGEERVVASATNIYAGMETCSKLANQNAASRYFLSTKALYTTTLCIRVATVAG